MLGRALQTRPVAGTALPRGQLALTSATRVTLLAGSRNALAFSVATPETERAGLELTLQAGDKETMQSWVDRIRAEVAPMLT